MVFTTSLLATTSLLSPTKKRTLFSRLPLSEPTINAFNTESQSSRFEKKKKKEKDVNLLINWLLSFHETTLHKTRNIIYISIQHKSMSNRCRDRNELTTIRKSMPLRNTPSSPRPRNGASSPWFRLPLGSRLWAASFTTRLYTSWPAPSPSPWTRSTWPLLPTWPSRRSRRRWWVTLLMYGADDRFMWLRWVSISGPTSPSRCRHPIRRFSAYAFYKRWQFRACLFSSFREL